MPTETQDISFAELGERESLCLFDGDLKLFPGEIRAEPLVVLTAQVRVGISELNHAVEPTGALQDRGSRHVVSFAVATTITPSCDPTPSRQFSKV